MHINHTKLIYGALFLASAFLTACGGGGGSTAPAATYSIGGTVSGLTGAGLVLRNGTENLSISASGSFTFTTKIAGGATYSVSVQTQPAGQTCTASSNSGTVAAANITNVSVVCSANLLSIGGNITGLAGTVVLQNNGADNLTISTAGSSSFTFVQPVARGAGYAVTVLTQPVNRRCTVTGGGTGSGSGTNVQANITSVVVTCVPVYTIGGTITGLGTSIGLVLQNNNNNNLTINGGGTGSDGFTFTTKLAGAENYNVKILIQPAAPALTCTVTVGSGTVAAVNITSVAIACVPPIPQFAFVANYNSNDVSVYSISAGVLAQVNCALPSVCTGSNFTAGTGPQSVTVTPSGKFVYVANILSGDISAYSIHPASGVLTQVNCVAGCNGANFLAGTNPIAVTVDPSGQFAYAANLNSADISVYSIDNTPVTGTGALTQINCTGDATVCSGNNFLAGNNPSSIVVDHVGRFAYVANANDNSVSAYSIDAVTGALTRVLCGGGATCETTSDPSGKNFLAGNGPQSLDIDPTSRFAYVANANENTVSAYAINATSGSLTPIDAEPLTVGVIENFAAGTNPTSIVVDPHGKYVYVANKVSGNISAFSIDNAPSGTGALTAIATPFAAGTNTTSVTVDLSGQFVYVANYGPPYDVSAYQITGTGALIQINCGGVLPICNGNNFLAGTNPASVITTVIY